MENFLIYLLVAFIITQFHLILGFIIKLKGNGVNRFVILINNVVYKLGLVFRLVNTLVHELGHVLMSVMTRGKVYKIELFSNAGGEAQTGSGKWGAKVLTSLAGYPFASLVSLLFVYLVSIDKSYIVVYLLVALLVGSIIFYVRNMFGLFWSISFLSLVLVMDSFASVGMMEGFILFIIAVMLVESVASALYILYLSIYNRMESGDAKNLAEFTKIPSMFYGIFFSSQALVLFYCSMTLL